MRANQNVRKLLSTDLVNTKTLYAAVLVKVVDILPHCVAALQIFTTISAGIISLITRHTCMSFQIFLLVGHFTNWAGHNLLADKTLQKITQDVLWRCSVIVSNHDAKLAGHFQNLVGQCLVTDCYFQHWLVMVIVYPRGIVLNAIAECGISEK